MAYSRLKLTTDIDQLSTTNIIKQLPSSSLSNFTQNGFTLNKVNGSKIVYQNEGQLGHGNFGAVYLYASENGAYKAVKFYQKNYRIRQEYDGYKICYPEREFFLHHKLESYLVMPFFNGVLLEKVKGNLNAWLKAAEAIHLLHKKGLIHGDLKTDNIIYDAKKNCCYLIDFGFCYKVDDNAITVSRYLRSNSVKRLWAPERYTVQNEIVAANENQDVYTFCKVMFDRYKYWQYDDYEEDIDSENDDYGEQYEAQELLLYNCLRSTLMAQDPKDRPSLTHIIKLIDTTIKMQKEMESEIKGRNKRIALQNNNNKNHNNSHSISLLLKAAKQVDHKSSVKPIVKQPIQHTALKPKQTPFDMLLLAIEMDEKKSKNQIEPKRKPNGIQDRSKNSSVMLFSANSNKRKRYFNDNEMNSSKIPAEKKRKMNNGNSIAAVNNSING